MPAERTMPRGESVFALGILLILVLFFSLAAIKLKTTEPNPGWGGDGFQYLMHAKAIADGRAYNDIPYIFNPNRPWIGPQTYPPGLPVFLALPVMLHGPDIAVLKLYKLPIEAGIIILTILLGRQYLPGHWPLLPGLLLAIHPLTVEIPYGILSEPLFTLLCLLTLYFANRLFLKGNSRHLPIAIFISLLVVAAALTRTVGAVFFPAIILFAAVRYRNVELKTIAITLILSISLFFAVNQLIPNPLSDYSSIVEKSFHLERETSALDSMKNKLLEAFHRLELVPSVASSAWIMGPTTPFVLFFSGLSFLVVATGFLTSIVRYVHLSDYFYLGYLSMLVVIPFGLVTRLFIPLTPLTLVFFAIGVYHIVAFLHRFIGDGRRAAAIEAAVAGFLVLPVLAMLVSSHFTFDKTSDTHAYNDRHGTAMIEFVKRTVPEGQVLLSSRPRVLYHLTGRPGSAPPAPLEESATIRWMDRLSAQYLLLVNMEFVRPPGTIRLVHTEGYLRLYYLPPPGERAGAASTTR